MPGRRPNFVLPLPKQWNKRARSAVLDASRWLTSGGRRRQRLGLRVSYLAERKHLPVVELKKAA